MMNYDNPPVKFNITLEFYPTHLIQELKVKYADNIYISNEKIIIKKGKATMKFDRNQLVAVEVEETWERY